MSNVPDQWRSLALYDLETAEAMLRAGRWMYVLFCCQQAVEKMLKGVIAAKTGELPPRTHNLVRLTEHADLAPDEVTVRKLRELSAFYIQSRYPDEVQLLAAQFDAGLARDVLREAKEVLAWLDSQTHS
ncbi:MAG: HEPN domain-containing protein [Deferrisomatales bacterium]